MLVDLLVIGGGINGCGVAADAAGRGLSVVLCEKDDLAFATSSSSSKLIHGGLRYLEQYHFKMVHNALKEREILMAKAPFLIRPIEFVIPYNKHWRPPFLIRLGLLLYDSLYLKRTLPRSRKLKLQKVFEGEPIRGNFKIGFRYSDCWTNDSRLVVLNAMAAREKGAHILTQTQCQSLKREKEYWIVELHDKLRDKIIKLKAKAVINAAGPWVSDIIKNVAYLPKSPQARFIKGSHILVQKLYEGSHAYTLQTPNGRIVFAMPYKKSFTLIGTTDEPYEGDPNLAAISQTEITYLCETVNRYFTKQISSDDIVWSYSGVRALYDDRSKHPSQISREYRLVLNKDKNLAPILSIFGGKLTTYRLLAEEVMKKLKPYFPKMGPAWTQQAKLPGGNCDGMSFAAFKEALEKKYPWLPVHILHRYAKIYGDLCHAFLSDCHSLDDMGRYFGAGLYEKEVLYQIQNEWAKKVDDILWRRTKLGLYMNAEQVADLKAYLS